MVSSEAPVTFQHLMWLRDLPALAHIWELVEAFGVKFVAEAVDMFGTWHDRQMWTWLSSLMWARASSDESGRKSYYRLQVEELGG